MPATVSTSGSDSDSRRAPAASPVATATSSTSPSARCIAPSCQPAGSIGPVGELTSRRDDRLISRGGAMTRALLIVDVQPTFCEGGELPVAGGNLVAERIADYLARHRGEYALVVTSQDWHSDPGGHFSRTPDFEHSWPPHG